MKREPTKVNLLEKQFLPSNSNCVNVFVYGGRLKTINYEGNSKDERGKHYYRDLMMGGNIFSHAFMSLVNSTEYRN